MRPEYEKVLTELAEQQGLSRERTLEQAIALYQLIQQRISEDYRLKFLDKFGHEHPGDIPAGLPAFDDA